MARSTSQKPYGGGPRIGSGAPQEPDASPSREGVGGSFGGAPTILGDRSLDRGAAQVGRDGGGVVIPESYGGGATFEKRTLAPSARGNGANTGAGAVDGNNVP